MNKVLAIFSKEYNENIYGECTYLSKNQAIEDLPAEIKQRVAIERC